MRVLVGEHIVFIPLVENRVLSRYVDMDMPVITHINNRLSIVAFETPSSTYERASERGREGEVLDLLVGLAFDDQNPISD